tara:strand:- start:148 stop:354 length:207 start_codon:yes stop_codon:yes gene_type:complete
MEVLLISLIIVMSIFFDYMLYLHFNTLFEDQFNITNKLIVMVNNNNAEEITDFDITGNEVMQVIQEEE